LITSARRRAAPDGLYSFEAGDWLVLALNSNIPIGAGSAQYAWVQDELALSTAQCTLVLMHHPLFSSSRHGSQPFVRDIWRVLYQHRVDLVFAGHDHAYERFAPQDPDGRSDPARGVRLIIAGTAPGPTADRAEQQVQARRTACQAGAAIDVGTWQFVPIPAVFSGEQAVPVGGAT
jgi:3',5'-cyclic AMP phosphodiesterase CpdA